MAELCRDMREHRRSGEQRQLEKTLPQPALRAACARSCGCRRVALSHRPWPLLWSPYLPRTSPLSFRNGFLVFLAALFCNSSLAFFHIILCTAQHHDFTLLDSKYLNNEEPSLHFNGYVLI